MTLDFMDNFSSRKYSTSCDKVQGTLENIHIALVVDSHPIHQL